MEYLIELGFFLARVAILAFAVIAVITMVMAAGMKAKKQASRGSITVKNLNRELEQMRDALRHSVYDRFSLKSLKKREKKRKKAEDQERKRAARSSEQHSGTDESKANTTDAGGAAPQQQRKGKERKKRVYVLGFKGDVAATQVESLRKEVTTVLSLAEADDEIVLRLESPGGMVHSYGLASSQLERIKQREIPLTICVDKVAASGGYMMACLADRLVAAPFAMLGSIGVLMQVPNFHRVLKKNDIDFEMITAGEHKRTLTLFGETTQKARDKAREDVEDIHVLFKDWVQEHRPVLDIDKVATGEVWFGTQAIERNLADQIATSDDYIMQACEDADVYEVRYEVRKNLGDKIGKSMQLALDRTLLDWFQRLRESRYFS